MSKNKEHNAEKPAGQDKAWTDPEVEKIVEEFRKKGAEEQPAEPVERAEGQEKEIAPPPEPLKLPAAAKQIQRVSKNLEAAKQYDYTVAQNILDHYLQVGKPSVKAIYLMLPNSMTTLSTRKNEEIDAGMAAGLILSPATGLRDMMYSFDLGEVQELMVSGSFGKALVKGEDGYRVMVVLYQHGTLGLARLIATNVIREVDRSARTFNSV